MLLPVQAAEWVKAFFDLLRLLTNRRVQKLPQAEEHEQKGFFLK